ncbi:hypothetical protein BaRGS_00027733 [Batillaria attramentaria]|uniref:Uncharacterized protein n=1 Tax=Batillaria attramentaria TaxID=370345 RepID=A0ABD0K1F6_9CAEN
MRWHNLNQAGTGDHRVELQKAEAPPVQTVSCIGSLGECLSAPDSGVVCFRARKCFSAASFHLCFCPKLTVVPLRRISFNAAYCFTTGSTAGSETYKLYLCPYISVVRVGNMG